MVDDQTLCPNEGDGTILQTVSFLYRIGDKALNAESYVINVTGITGAIDLSGKTQEGPGNGSGTVNISFDSRHTFAYCAEPLVRLERGTRRNMSADIFIDLKQDTNLSNWLIDKSLSEGYISAGVMARVITNGGDSYIPLIRQRYDTRVIGLAGSFTAPKNVTAKRHHKSWAYRKWSEQFISRHNSE